jgi:threonine/homoserine/homoserine lactone efflux protein
MAATLGLSALILSSAVAFSAVKYVGAAYLIYLGIRTLLAREGTVSIPAPKKDRLGRMFGQGIVVSTLNPKTALFFLAFLPQFVDRSRGSVPEQVLLLGILFVAMGICTDGLYALLSGTIGGWLRDHLGFFRVQRYVSGTIYIGLGVTTALAGANKR